MSPKTTSSDASSTALTLALIFYAAVLAQMVGTYFYDAITITGDFRLATFAARFGLPFLVIVIRLKCPLSELGWRWPQLTQKQWLSFILLIAAIPIISFVIRSSQSYTDYYHQSFAPQGALSERLRQFGLFTASTFFGYEFLNRSFLLFGLRRTLVREHGVNTATAGWLALLVVMAFEAMVHFTKPVHESFGLMIASPIFSWMALRTESIVLPLVLHFTIEVVFILALIL